MQFTFYLTKIEHNEFQNIIAHIKEDIELS